LNFWLVQIKYQHIILFICDMKYIFTASLQT
jgi:hypothetical protein